MKTQVCIKTDQENQENVQVMNRKPLKMLQEGSIAKENFSGHSNLCNKCRTPITNSDLDTKAPACINEKMQTGEPVITVKDLTSEDEPSADYWRVLAETRAKSLDESLDENEKLHQLVQSLDEENQKCKEMLDESRTLVDVLKELIEENECSEVTEDSENTEDIEDIEGIEDQPQDDL